MYSIGFDPAYRNLGVGILNLSTWKGNFYNVDLAQWDDKVHTLQNKDYSTIVYDYLRTLKPFLDQAVRIAIEDQPPFGTKEVYGVQCHITSLIRGMYPNLDIYTVPMRSVRALWKTHGSTYNQRKANSMKTDIVSSEEAVCMRHVFEKMDMRTKRKEFHVDAIEAMQISVYATLFEDKLTMTKLNKEPRKFKTLEHSCQVNKPDVQKPEKEGAHIEKKPGAKKRVFKMPETNKRSKQ